jgi:circadian clock protein KaiC
MITATWPSISASIYDLEAYGCDKMNYVIQLDGVLFKCVDETLGGVMGKDPIYLRPLSNVLWHNERFFPLKTQAKGYFDSVAYPPAGVDGLASEPAALEYPRVKSGITGLDTMLKGGFPKGRVILIRGTPGMGKTILCAQFLHKGAEQGERGMFVSLEESRDQIIREMYLVGMDLRDMKRDGPITFIDASPIRNIPGEVKFGGMQVGKRDFSLVALAKKIKTTFEEKKPERIVIDPLTALSIQYPNDNERRLMVLDLIEVLTQSGATCLVTEELQGRVSTIEEYSVHGVLLLRSVRAGITTVKALEIVKMRESKHDDQPRLYQIVQYRSIHFG